MGQRLADGLYEQVVTGALAVELALLQPGRQSTVEPLGTADSHSALARHLAIEVERALAAVPHADRPSTQVAIVNGLPDELHRLAGPRLRKKTLLHRGIARTVEPGSRNLGMQQSSVRH